VADRKGASLVVYVVDDDASIRGSLALMHIMEKLKVRNIAELVRFAFHPRHPSFIGD
jgi:FixJ family two-component response regulator